MRLRLIWTALALLMASSVARGQTPVPQADFWVAPGGNDANPGTELRPFATLHQAQAAVRRRIAEGLNHNLLVLIHQGTYELAAPLVFGSRDCGSAQDSVTYAAYPGETVVISGGRRVGGWQAHADGIWTTRLPSGPPNLSQARDFYVNGHRATRARTPNADAQPSCWRLTGAQFSPDLQRFTLTLRTGLVKDWPHPDQIEVMIAGNWEINRLRVQSVNATTGTVVLAPPHIAGPAYILPARGRWCYFSGPREFLDQPGEWSLNPSTGILSYWPRPHEDLSRSDTVVPALQQLVKLAGQPGRPACNLHFRGLRFAYTDWQLPAPGFQGSQAGTYSTAGPGSPQKRIVAVIAATDARQCSFEDCVLTCLGGCGIELGEGCHDNLIEGCQIFDTGSNGINVGGPNNAARVPTDNRIANNAVHACGQDDYGAVGIWVGLSQRTVVAHNLVYDLPYTGISVGWQWDSQPTACRENRIEYNHVYDVMRRLCDGGAIYTLGLQPGTVIRGNDLHDVHRNFMAQGAPNNGMFLDEGSKGYLIEQNVVYKTSGAPVRFNRSQKDWHTWRDNYFGYDAAQKPAAREVTAQAGPQPPYRRRFAANEQPAGH